MRELTVRVLDNLLEVKNDFDLHHLTEPCILVSHDLIPSTTAQLDKKFVLGFATDLGGHTSHTAIICVYVPKFFLMWCLPIFVCFPNSVWLGACPSVAAHSFTAAIISSFVMVFSK